MHPDDATHVCVVVVVVGGGGGNYEPEGVVLTAAGTFTFQTAVNTPLHLAQGQGC
jgi:hypothetical protein